MCYTYGTDLYHDYGMHYFMVLVTMTCFQLKGTVPRDTVTGTRHRYWHNEGTSKTSHARDS